MIAIILAALFTGLLATSPAPAQPLAGGSAATPADSLSAGGPVG